MTCRNYNGLVRFKFGTDRELSFRFAVIQYYTIILEEQKVMATNFRKTIFEDKVQDLYNRGLCSAEHCTITFSRR
jgi:hypothetical protein